MNFLDCVLDKIELFVDVFVNIFLDIFVVGFRGCFRRRCFRRCFCIDVLIVEVFVDVFPPRRYMKLTVSSSVTFASLCDFSRLYRKLYRD